MIIEGQTVVLPKWQLEEILEKRVKEQGIPIDQLFLVLPVVNDYEGDTMVETVYGKLRTFFTRQCPPNKSLVLWNKKFPYPRKNVVELFTKDGDLIR